MFSFGPDIQTIEFKDSVVQLTGKNGAGKSSIPTILEELFYNKNSRGVKKAEIPNRHTDKKHYLCTAWFTKNNDEYCLVKIVKTTTSLKLTKNGEDISGHTATQTYEIVEKIIGLDFNTFSKLVYQSMVSSLDFLTATDANRKKFLVSLLGLERYSEIQEQVKSVASETKQSLAAAQSRVEYLNNNVQGYKEEAPMDLVPVEYPDATLSNEVAALKLEIANIEKTNKDIKANLLIADSISKLKTDLVICEPTARTKDQLLGLKATLEANHKAKTTEYNSLANAKTHCPTCNKPFDGDFSHQKEKMAKLKEEAAVIAKEHAEVKAELEKAEKYATYSTKLTQIKDLESRFDSTKPTQLLDVNTLTSKLKSIEKEIDKQNLAVQAANSHNLKATAHNAKIEERKATVNKFKEELVTAVSTKLTVESKSNQLGVLVDAYGTKGLISYKIETMVKTFESLINQYLQLLSNGKFVLTFVVEDTKLALKLYDDGHEISIGQVSSGEFNKINTATLLAVRRMMTSLSKVDINVLFLDEVVSVLDTESKDTLIEVLLREPKMNSVVVSHGYKHPLASAISVVKCDNLSRLIHE